MSAQTLLQRVLGAGKLYFDQEDASGNLTGEQYLGDTPGFALDISNTMVESWSSDGPTAEREASSSVKVTRGATLTAKNVSQENLALFIQGDVGDITATSAPVTGESIGAVKQGLYYQLGKMTAKPQGTRAVSAETVKDGVPTTYTIVTDYTIDYDLARIYIVPGGTIVDGTDLLIDYTQDAKGWEEITSNDLGPAIGALHYVANNTDGPNRDVYIPRLRLYSTGSLNFKDRSKYLEMQFKMDVLLRTGAAQLYIDGRPA